jgi:hypothetical protein
MARDIIKEQWIDEVIGSTEGIQRAKPAGDFFEKVTQGLSRPAKSNVYGFPVKQWAAAAILLLALNVGSVVYFTSQKRKAAMQSVNNPFTIDMPTVTTYNY